MTPVITTIVIIIKPFFHDPFLRGRLSMLDKKNCGIHLESRILFFFDINIYIYFFFFLSLIS